MRSHYSTALSGPAKVPAQVALVLKFCLLLALGSALASGCASAATANTNAPLSLKVAGNKVVNSRGEPVLLRGVNAASLEWSSNGERRILNTVKVAIHDWHVNVVRLPLSQDRWFGHAPEQTNNFQPYRDLVRAVVETCAANQCYVILDLHWSNCNEWGQNIGQHSMPDTNSAVFWQDLAPRYANHPAVIFDLYNEPHDVSWEVWLNGGVITDKPNGRWSRSQPKIFEAVGMQQLLDTVRATGAKNVVVVGGRD